jgi:hypothetical protein
MAFINFFFSGFDESVKLDNYGVGIQDPHPLEEY